MLNDTSAIGPGDEVQTRYLGIVASFNYPMLYVPFLFGRVRFGRDMCVNSQPKDSYLDQFASGGISRTILPLITIIILIISICLVHVLNCFSV
jgi:hypothetical protein